MIPLKRKVDILARLTERARTYFDVYKFYVGSETRPLIISQMNGYPWFFRMQEHVFRYTLFVELAALFEEDRKTICFHAVLIEIRSAIPNDLFVSLSKKLKDASRTSKKIIRLRNKAFAHRDSVEDFNDVFKAAAITLDQIEETIELARDVCVLLCDHFGVQRPVITTVETIEDCRRLFQALGSPIESVE